MSSPAHPEAQPSSPSSPPRGSRPTSPRSPPRRPLRERRPAETNSAAGPTIRIIEDPGSPVSGKSPFPTQPSQTLSPDPVQGFRPGNLNVDVSGRARSANAGADSQRSSFVQRMVSTYEGKDPKPLDPQPRQSESCRASTSTMNSNTDTLNTFSPSSSSRFSQGTTPPTSPLPFSERKHDSFGSLGLLQEDRPVAPTVRAVIPSSSTAGASDPVSPSSHHLTSRPSETSFDTSSSSTPTLTYHRHDDPRHSSISSFSENTTAQRPPTRGKDESRRSSWASASHVASDERPQTRGYNTARHDTEEQRPPTRGSNSIQSFSSNHTVERRPSKANLRAFGEASDDSLDFSPPESAARQSTDRPRSASSPVRPTHADRTIELEDGTTLHYPLITPPSASGSWVDSRTLPKHPSRMTEPEPEPEPELEPDYRRYRWSPPLSTIESVSEPRTGSVASTLALSGFSGPKRRQTLGSIGSVGEADIASTPSEFSVVPRPLFSPRDAQEQREGKSYSEEGNDTVGELNAQPLRPQRSGLFRRNSNLSNDGRPDTSASDRSSYTSLFLNTVPQWAREYYRRGGDRNSLANSLGAPSSSTESSGSPHHSRTCTMQSGASRSPTETNFPISAIWSPRRRRHHHHRQSSGRNSEMYATPQVPPKAAQHPDGTTPPGTGAGAATPGSRAGPPGTREAFTPRLRKDRRNTTLSVWTVPSIDEALGTLFTGRGQPANKQILFFCLGFVVPLCWLLAAFLPLPPRPVSDEEEAAKGKEKAGAPVAGQSDVERGLGLGLRNGVQAAQRDWQLEERRWLKARWWRRLNRGMTVAGVCVVAAVVALVVTSEV